MKTRRTRNKVTKSKKQQTIVSLEPPTDYSQTDADADILYLKQTPYTNDTEMEFKSRLERSTEFRKTLMHDLDSNILSNFPYLFVHYDLVRKKIVMRVISSK